MTPCKKQCKVVDGRCVSCKRTLSEISQWMYMNDNEFYRKVNTMWIQVTKDE